MYWRGQCLYCRYLAAAGHFGVILTATQAACIQTLKHMSFPGTVCCNPPLRYFSMNCLGFCPCLMFNLCKCSYLRIRHCPPVPGCLRPLEISLLCSFHHNIFFCLRISSGQNNRSLFRTLRSAALSWLLFWKCRQVFGNPGQLAKMHGHAECTCYIPV